MYQFVLIVLPVTRRSKDDSGHSYAVRSAVSSAVRSAVR